MSAFVILDSISLATPDGRPLFDGLTLALGRERTGLVGRNGCGKSTLLRLIGGDIEPASGSRAAHRARSACSRNWQTSASRSARRSASPTLSPACGGSNAAKARSTMRPTPTGRWKAGCRPRWPIPACPHCRSIARSPRSSGGERTRVALARLLIEAPDLLLLDEPTNNLDTDGRQAVAQLLERWQGGILVASHDRALLERVDRIVELTPVGVTVFGGAWSAFAEAREAARDRAAGRSRAVPRTRCATPSARVQKAREKKARRDKAGRAWRAKGVEDKMFMDREKERAENSAARESHLADRLIGDRADALDQARARVEILTPLAIDLPKTELPDSRELVAFTDVTMAFGERHLFGPLSFEVRGPERIAIRGANGSGKTTLLRLITGDLEPPTRRRSIAAPTASPCSTSMSACSIRTGSILDNLRRLNPEMTGNEAHAALARFAFRNRAALQIAGTLSGGERLRAGLACVFARPAAAAHAAAG